jgi:hypothetical protein
MLRTDNETKAWAEGQYKKVDPWSYQRTADDAFRKEKVIAACLLMAPFPGKYRRALDIGAGEGWITRDLPAMEKFGVEISDAAASRFPDEVMRVAAGTFAGAFNLVISTETMFEHYNWKAIRDQIIAAAAPGGVIVTCNNPKWEVKALEKVIGEPVLRVEFPYKTMSMVLKAWRV